MRLDGFITIARLTFLEARRRRLVLAALAGGLLMLLVFAIALYLIHTHPAHQMSLLQLRLQMQLAALAGFYAVNLLTVAVAIMLPVDALSGEIASGVMQTLASKPVGRAEILLAKWFVFWLMISAYVAMLVIGIVVSLRLITGFSQPHAVAAAALLILQATVLLSVVIAAGVRLTTVTNGLVAFSFYSIAVVGGWIEQIAVVVGNEEARYVGTVISLVSPTDALWRRALSFLAPPMSQVQLVPFLPTSVPSAAMVWWSIAFVCGALLVGMRWFNRRPL